MIHFTSGKNIKFNRLALVTKLQQCNFIISILLILVSILTSLIKMSHNFSYLLSPAVSSPAWQLSNVDSHFILAGFNLPALVMSLSELIAGVKLRTSWLQHRFAISTLVVWKRRFETVRILEGKLMDLKNLRLDMVFQSEDKLGVFLYSKLRVGLSYSKSTDKKH